VSRIGVAYPTSICWRPSWTLTWTPLATALCARTDDLLKATPERVPWRPVVGIAPRIGDAELITVAVMQALLGYTSEARWRPYVRTRLRHLFPVLPQWWSTPPGRAGATTRDRARPDLSDLAEYGYCASHSRFFWGLRLHLLCHPARTACGFAVTGAKADEGPDPARDPRR
jgi:hypothetical protein